MVGAATAEIDTKQPVGWGIDIALGMDLMELKA
jgi:hypothetical protein